MVPPVLGAVRLMETFDAPAMAAELAALEQGGWTPHFNTGVYQGHWTGLALRAPGGSPHNILPGHGPPVAMQDTPLMAQCPTLAGVVRFFQTQVGSVRLLRLGAGGVIRPHRDAGLALEDRQAIRLHVPVVTHAQVAFTLEGETIPLDAGTCWYINVNLTHAVHNASAVDRIHLVMDLEVNPWLWDLLHRPDCVRRFVTPPRHTPDPTAVAAELRRVGTPTALALADALEAQALATPQT